MYSELLRQNHKNFSDFLLLLNLQLEILPLRTLYTEKLKTKFLK
jgi:hypothetical protein